MARPRVEVPKSSASAGLFSLSGLRRVAKSNEGSCRALAREPIEMEDGTTFRFVTDGFDAGYAQARETAGDDGEGIAGGA